MIVAAAEIESSLLARRLGALGRREPASGPTKKAPSRCWRSGHWDALLVDYPLARNMIAHGDVARLAVRAPHRADQAGRAA